MNAPRVDDKTFATLQARAALLRCQLLRTDDDRGREIFIVVRDAWVKTLEGAEAVNTWIKRLGGPNA